MELRKVRPSEYREAGEVTAGAYAEFARPGAGWEEYSAELADVAGRIDRTEVYAAVEHGEVLGCVTLELDQTVGDDDESLPPDTSCVRMLGVRPDARGRGIGRALVQLCIDRTRETGRSIVTLRTTDLMQIAQRLYLDMGFERDEDRDFTFESGFKLLAFRLALQPGDRSEAES